ncbi:MAG TPA: TonB-dependent receptor, partial [Bryobacteraceae bacterium]|nr:TonB-dependent receptor [Bryobacteraceae bacterium]
FGRLDYNISDKNRLTLSVTQRDNPGFNPSPDAPLDVTTSDIASYNAQISDVWSMTPNTVNEFRFGFTRQANNFAPATLGQGLPAKLGWAYNEADIAPGVNITGTCCSGIGPGTNAIYNENSFDPSDVVTLIRGRHILKFGGEVLMYQDNATPWGNINAGNFTFSGVFTQRGPNDSTNGAGGQSGIGYADFLLGQVSQWNASNTPIVGFRQKSPQFFVQDDWKITQNLTLNLGLRYQIQGGWSEVRNRLGDFDPTLVNPATNTLGAMWFGGNNGRTNLEANNYKIFLPRVGFAWSPRNNWVVRGGFGIYSYNWSIDTYSGGSEGLGTNSQGSLSQTDQVNPVFILGQATYADLNYTGPSRDPVVYNGQGINYVPYHTPVARNYQYSLSIQHQLGGGMMIQAAYVGSHGTNLSFPMDLNQVPFASLAQSVALSNSGGDPQSLRPYPQYQGISANLFNGISNYNSAQLTFTKRLSSGLQFDLNYTWSRMQDDQDSSGWGSRDGGQVYQYAVDPDANYGPSNFDIPHMFKGDVTYQLPVGKGRTYLNRGGVLDAVLGGWQASTIFVLETGRPYTAVVGTSNNSGSLAGQWYPNLVGDPSISNPNVNQWFNPAAFAIPEPGTFGNSGRNNLRGPGISDVDFSLGKNFRIPLPRETGTLQLRFDAMNVLNHPNFDIPNANIGTGGAGTITGTTGNYNTTNNAFGARRLQLGARFSF